MLGSFMSFLSFCTQLSLVKIWLKSRYDHQLNTKNDTAQIHSKNAKLLLNKHVSVLGLIFSLC